MDWKYMLISLKDLVHSFVCKGLGLYRKREHMSTYTLCTNIFRLYICWLYMHVWIMLIQQWDYFMLWCEIYCKLTAFSGCLLCIEPFLNPVSLQCSPYLQPQFSFLPIEALQLPCFPARTHWLLRWAGFSAENAAAAAALGCERCVGLPFASISAASGKPFQNPT